jgi:hypothetical protein
MFSYQYFIFILIYICRLNNKQRKISKVYKFLHFWQTFCLSKSVQTKSQVMKTYKHQYQIGRYYLNMIFAAILLSISVQGFAQTGTKYTLSQMIEEDRTTIDAIAGYDRTIQSHILKVAETPEVLYKIEELQKKSQDQFKSIIVGYDQDAQEAFYNLARYPNLISDLVTNGHPSNSEINRIISNYPQDIHETTQQYAPRYFDVLLRIDRLNNEIDREFRYVLDPYSQDTRESVNVLIGYPEIVSALVDDKDFTAILGKVFRQDPGWLMNRLGLISQELAEQNRDDVEAYKNQIQKDPEAYNELLDASERFSQERNVVRYIDYSDPVLDIRVINSYPYWFGYPYWYTAPYWRPRPLYYHTGFYRNHFGNVVFVGLPSNFFLHWHTFYHPRWFPHLTYNYYNFYENHYMKHYRESPHAFPHHGFYRSIEANVINNPRVNNSRLEKIDHQRGNNIVRQPNTMESRTTRRGDTGISRSNQRSYSRQATGTGGTVNRRGYDAVKSGSKEGPYNRNGSIQRNGSTQPEDGSIQRNSSIRRDATPAPSSQGGTSTGRSQRKTSDNNSSFVRPRSGVTGTTRIREKSPTTVIQRGPAGTPGGSTEVRQRSTAPQVNNATPVPTERTGRTVTPAEAPRGERSSAAQRREINSQPTVQPSVRSAQSEAKTVTEQPATRKEAREKKAATRSNTTESSKNDESNGRRR